MEIIKNRNHFVAKNTWIKFSILFFVFYTLVLPRTAFGYPCWSIYGEPADVDPELICEGFCVTYIQNVEVVGETVYCTCPEGVFEFTVTELCEIEQLLTSQPPAPATTTPATTVIQPTPTRPLLKPRLSVDIPTVHFTDGVIDGDKVTVDYMGEYISGMYKWMIGVGTLIAIVMLMVSGLQWALFQEAKAKKRMKEAVTGLILLLCAYLILAIVNPRLVIMKPLEIEVVPFSPLAIKYASEQEQTSSCRDRPKIALTKKNPMTNYAQLTIPSASSCTNTRIPQTIRDQAYTSQKSTGAPAAILLAQWAVESEYGKRCVGEHKNNCWGIKCTENGKYAGNDTLMSSGNKPTCPSGCGAYTTKEVKNGTTDDYWACFQDFNSLSEAMSKHATVVKKTGWEDYNGDPEIFAKFVQNNCYATAPDYAEAIIGVMKNQCLYSSN